LKYKFSTLSAIAYYLALPFLYLISLLPFPLMYLLSNGVYVLLYYVIGYRKKVVWTNLKNSFPNKSEQEIKRLQKDFYHYLCDLFLETLKLLTVSKETIWKHGQLTTETMDLLAKYAAQNKPIIIAIGHLGNWEWAGAACSIANKQQPYIIYHPLRNKQFDGLVRRIRTKFGAKLITKKDTIREMLAHKGESSATVFVTDQTAAPESAYWTTFLNQDTPVFRGTAKIAQKLNYPIVYAHIERVKRGYYIMHTETLIEEPAKLSEDEITEMHTRRLEKDIIVQPEIWLWSHRRWKHKRPVN